MNHLRLTGKSRVPPPAELQQPFNTTHRLAKRFLNQATGRPGGPRSARARWTMDHQTLGHFYFCAM